MKFAFKKRRNIDSIKRQNFKFISEDRRHAAPEEGLS